MTWRFRRNKKMSDLNREKKKSGKLRFICSEFKEDARYIKNPAQGWYSIYPFRAEKKINPEELKWCLKEDETVVLVLLDLGAYQKSPLDFFALENISEILRFFKNYHKDVILRPVYDQYGEGRKWEPDTIEQILQHIKQLSEILNGQEHTVFLFQGFLIGSWGEMHSSRYLSREYLQKLYRCIRQNLSPSIPLAVRTPAIWRSVIKEDGLKAGKKAGLTLFNDALFASATDLGTYGTMTKEAAGWTGQWNRLEELQFEERITEGMPFGGEAVAGEMRCQSSLLREIQKLHLSYLNSNHDLNLLNQWKEEKWNQKDCFYGKSFYEYVGAHMGARFVVRHAEIKYRKGSRKLKLVIEIENCGFGRVCQETEVLVIIENIQEKKEVQTEINLREWKSGERRKVTCTLPLMQGNIYLKGYRKKDKEIIRFANKEKSKHKKEQDRFYLGCMRYEEGGMKKAYY